jgi:DNA-binding NarL/FixJ family response regulator
VPSPVVIRALSAAGVLAAFQHDVDAAARLYDEELRLARLYGDPYRLGEALIDVGHLAYVQEDFDQAEAQTEEAYRLLKGIESSVPAARPMAALALSNLGDVAAAQGNLRLAASRYAEAAPCLRQTAYRWGLFEAMCGLGMIRLRQERPGEASPVLHEALLLAWDMREPMQLADALRGASSFATVQDDLDRSATLSGAASALERKIGTRVSPRSRPLAQRTREVLAAHLEPALLQEHWAKGEAMPIAAVVELARDVLRQGVIDAAATPRPEIKLTPRERDVLRLLSGGLSNPEIGAALFIGVRTVQTHVGNIFAKLGVNSRAEAATVATRRGLV